MPRAAAKSLDVKTIEALKPRAAVYRVSDGSGLLLEVKPTGAKVWLCRLTMDGRRRDMGLGGYPAVSLKNARVAARKARELVIGGADPIAARAAEADARRAARDVEATAAREAGARTFRAVTEACIIELARVVLNRATRRTMRGAHASAGFRSIAPKPTQ